MNLSKHFTFEELTGSNGHPELVDKNRLEAAAYTDELKALAALLELVREMYNKPLIILSGFRCPALNVAVKGSVTSQHMNGEAADFYIPGVSLDEIVSKLSTSFLKFGQVIREPGWIHISTPGAGHIRQVLVYDGKNYHPYAGQKWI